ALPHCSRHPGMGDGWTHSPAVRAFPLSSMIGTTVDAWADRLACPDCELGLDLDPSGISCRACGYSTTWGQPLDLRPCRPRIRTLTADLVSRGPAMVDRCKTGPPVPSYGGPKAQRDSSMLFSAVRDHCYPG